MDDLISRQAAIDAILAVTGNSSVRELFEHVQEHGLSEMWSGGVNAAIDVIIAVPSAQPETHDKRTKTHSCDCISRQAAIDATWEEPSYTDPMNVLTEVRDRIKALPSAQPEIIRCKDCEFGEQDEVGRWFCRSLGCQIGNEDGSGFCADAERRTDE